MYFHENTLNSIVFQSHRKLELEVKHILANILYGDLNTVGYHSFQVQKVVFWQ